MKLFWETMAANGDVNYPKLANKISSNNPNMSITKARKQAQERVLAFQLINKANNQRFGELKEEIQKLESRDMEKYPITLTKAMETLQNHKSQKKQEFKVKNKSNNNSNKNQQEKEDKKVEGSYAQKSSTWL